MGSKKVKFDFRPLAGVRVTSSRKKSRIMNRVSSFVSEQVIDDVTSSKTPVKGGKFKKSLSDEYQKRKLAAGGSGVADLVLEGDLLSGLRVIRKSDNVLRLTVDDDQQKKADGHNNFTGNSALPERNFVPDTDRKQDFKKKIWDGIRRIVDEETGK